MRWKKKPENDKDKKGNRAMNQNEITINGEVYILKSSIPAQAAPGLNGMRYCIIRTYSAGVFAGYIEKREGKEATIRNARRIWYWDGACSLSQLAKDGTCLPDKCKFAIEVDEVLVTEVIEIIPCTEKAMQSIKGVPELKK